MDTEILKDADVYYRVAELLTTAKTLVITAGAGMGVDSGMPDYRGTTGFWNAYPLYEKLGLQYMDLATPANLEKDPLFSWGFFGHCTKLYRETIPHEGFSILRQWINRFELDWHVITSNIDGQFQKAGFAEDRIVEIHGSLHHMQCYEPCKPELWTNDETVEVNMETMRADRVPECRLCHGIARPNILMFCDFQWIPVRSNQQQRSFDQCSHWSNALIIEMGAGKGIPTIRWMGEKMCRDHGATLVRINPREPQVNSPNLSIQSTALEALTRINALL